MMVLRLPVDVWSKLHNSKDAIRRTRTLEGGRFLLLQKLALELTFDLFTTKRVFCIGQYD
jgi:hypothetical protein